MSWQDPGRTSSRPLACGPVPGYFSEYGTSCGEHSRPGDLVGPWVRAFVTATDVGLEPHGACTRMAAASGASPLIATIASMGKQMFGAAARRGGGSEGNDGSSPSPGVPSARPGGEPPPPTHHHPCPRLTAESPLRLLVVPVTVHQHILPLWGTRGASSGPLHGACPLTSLAFDPSCPGASTSRGGGCRPPVPRSHPARVGDQLPGSLPASAPVS